MNPVAIFIITFIAVLGVLGGGAICTCLASLGTNGDDAALVVGGVLTIVSAIATAVGLPMLLRGKPSPVSPNRGPDLGPDWGPGPAPSSWGPGPSNPNPSPGSPDDKAVPGSPEKKEP